MLSDQLIHETADTYISEPGLSSQDVALKQTGEESATSIEFQRTPRQFLIRVSGVMPTWLAPVVEDLNALLALPANWDSYGALPIKPELANAAVQLLSFVMRARTPRPQIIPTNRGGLSIEWHTQRIDLEVEVLSQERFRVSFQDDETGEEREEIVAHNLAPLVELIARVSN